MAQITLGYPYPYPRKIMTGPDSQGKFSRIARDCNCSLVFGLPGFSKLKDQEKTSLTSLFSCQV